MIRGILKKIGLFARASPPKRRTSINPRGVAVLIFASLALCSALTGCFGGSPEASQSGKNVPSFVSDGIASGKYTKYDNQIEIRIPVYDRSVQGQQPVDNNYWTRYIQESFGDELNIKVTYVPINRTNGVEKFTMMLAVNEAPDLIFDYDYPVAMKYYSMGVFQEIPREMLERYAPNFWVHSADIMDYGIVDGKQIFLPATRPEVYNYVTLIRQDWLDAAGLQMPSNITEFENALRKFKELNLGGETTIPYTLSVISPNTMYNYPFRDYPPDQEEIALYSDISVASLPWDATRRALKWYNQMFNEGLISPDWAIDRNGDKAQADFVSGKGGVFSYYYLSTNSQVIQNLLNANPSAKLAILDPRAMSPEGTKVARRAYWPFGMLNGINASSKHPEAVLMLLDWMSEPENLFTLQNGIEDLTYTMDGGLPKPTEYDGEERLNYNSNKDLWCLVTEGKDFGNEEDNLKVQMVTYVPEGFEYLIEDNKELIDKYLRPNEYEDYLFSGRTIGSLSIYQANLKALWEEYQIKLITCRPSEFDYWYDLAVENYLDSGYQEILDEKLEVYRETTSN